MVFSIIYRIYNLEDDPQWNKLIDQLKKNENNYCKICLKLYKDLLSYSIRFHDKKSQQV